MVVVISFSETSTQASAQSARLAIQENFSAEDEGVKRPVVLPSEVLELLSADDSVREQMKEGEPKLTELPQTWFSASEIQLGTTKTNDLIVQATGPLVGANVVEFWVFIPTRAGWKLALMVPVHDLRVMRTRYRGYRKIEVSGATCCTIATARYRFDGSRYQQYFSKTEQIK